MTDLKWWKKDKIQVNKTRNGCENIIIDIYKTKRFVREYNELLYVNKLDNLDEVNKSLDTQKLPNLTEEKMENLNRPITDLISNLKISQQRKF